MVSIPAYYFSIRLRSAIKVEILTEKVIEHFYNFSSLQIMRSNIQYIILLFPNKLLPFLNIQRSNPNI